MTIASAAVDGEGSFAWIADPAEPFRRASAALVLAGGCLLVDPVDGPGLDASLAPLGPVLGVATLFGRHGRDADTVAARHGAPRLLPRALGGAGIALPGVEERVVGDWPGWRESLLWLPDRRLLVCMETLGTLEFFLARSGDRLGMHPLARLLPVRRAFAGIAPEAIAVGHGYPLTIEAAGALERALERPKRDLPRAWLRAARLAREQRRRSA